MRGQRPQDLVFTLFGEYLLERQDFVWVGSLIALLEPLGLTEGGVRTVLSRMAKKGWLETERSGRSSFYALTDRGRALLEEGQARIYHPTWDREWDGRWFLLAYSIPQNARRARDRLRDRLAWLGFGSIGNGLWISPRDVESEVLELSERLDLGDHLICFHANPARDLADAELVQRCWDLDDLDERYADFAERWTRTAASFAPGRGERHGEDKDKGEDEDEDEDERDGGGDDVGAFVTRFELIHEFRRFPLEDPFLPRALLPSPWAGDDAVRVFRELHDRLVGPADRWVANVLDRAPARARPRAATA